MAHNNPDAVGSSCFSRLFQGRAPANASQTTRELEALVRELQEEISNMCNAQVKQNQGKPLMSDLRTKVDLFFKRQDSSEIQMVFCKHVDKGVDRMLPDRLQPALEELGLRLNPDDAKSLFRIMSRGEGGLDFQGFEHAVNNPTKLTQFALSLPLAELLASTLSFVEDMDGDPIRLFSRLTEAEVLAVSEAHSEALRRLLSHTKERLKKSFTEMDNRAQVDSGSKSKFQTSKMNVGKVDDFHKGLLERIGAPNPNLQKGMLDEHCHMAGFDLEFISTNYGVATTPQKEYEIVLGKHECAEEDMHDKRGRCVRVIRRLSDLKALELTQRAKVTDDEILAVVLYTGPMFQVYNTVLRRYPAEIFASLDAGGNRYSTTIHVLVSAVVKISRVMKLPAGLKLYRGLGGLLELPESFLDADENGCCGFMEWGFFSTTSSKTTAIEYSGALEGRPLPTVITLSIGAIDRGACIKDFSQYPEEVEYLWVPCSFLEAAGAHRVELVEDDGGDVQGVVTMVPVRINANLKTKTVEELRDQMKDLHITGFRYMLDDLTRDLKRIAAEGDAEGRINRDSSRRHSGVTFTVTGFLAHIMKECREVMARHQGVPSERYAVDEVYRALVIEMLDTKAAAVSTLRLYLEDSGQLIETWHRNSLKVGQRYYMAELEKQSEAASGVTKTQIAEKICRAMGLFQTTVDERDADGYTRLMRAAADGEGARVIRSLLAAGADINAANSDGWKSFWLAAQYGHVELLDILIHYGCDVDEAELSFGVTPVWIAAQNGHTAAIEALHRLGADIDKPRNGSETPLHIAAQLGYLSSAEALVRLGADVHALSYGASPLDFAERNKHTKVASFLKGIMDSRRAKEVDEDDGLGQEDGLSDEGGKHGRESLPTR